MCKKNYDTMTAEEMLKEYAHLKATEKGVADSIKTLKGKILEKMGDKREMTEGAFTASLIAKSRKSLDAGLVEKVLGVKVNAECYKKTDYDELRVTDAK